MFEDDNKNMFLYILKSANSFHKTYQLLETLIQKNSNENPYIITSIVNSTFAIELYIKSILTYNKISYKKGNKGHHLNYLFELVPIDIQNSIKLKYESEIEKSQNLCLYNSLQEYLDGEYNSFEIWRYIYDDWKEKSRHLFPNNETKILLNALKKECDEIKESIFNG